MPTTYNDTMPAIGSEIEHTLLSGFIIILKRQDQETFSVMSVEPNGTDVSWEVTFHSWDKAVKGVS